MNARHQRWIAGLANRHNDAILDPDVGFHDAPVIDNQRIGDQHIRRLRCAYVRRLSHTIAQHFATTELHLITVDREIALDLNKQLGVGQPHAVAHCRTIHLRIDAPCDRETHAAPPVASVLPKPCSTARVMAASRVVSVRGPLHRLLSPYTSPVPAKATSTTGLRSPGQKRPAGPAGILRCLPNARRRGNTRALLTSKKCICDPTWIGRSP